MTRREQLTLLLRVLMEAGIVAALAYWGVDTGDQAGTRLLYGIGAPAVGFGFWGAVDFHQLGRFAEAARLVEELAISGSAAAAAYAAGLRWFGIGLGALSAAYHAFVYATGARLSTPQRPRAPRSATSI